MSTKPPFRPWGTLEWALNLSSSRHWRFFGCVAAEQRSISALVALHRLGGLASFEMLRIFDTIPADLEAENKKIQEHIENAAAAGCRFRPLQVELEAALQNETWKQKFSFQPGTSFCLDISSLPKRFFFRAIKAALSSTEVRDFLILYTKPKSYAKGSLSGNPKDWATISGFGCADPDDQSAAASRLIVGAGFAVDGLHDHLEGRSGGVTVDVLIPFPADPWRSVRRSWESARAIEEALGADPEKGTSEVKPAYHQISALDTSTAFEKLLSLTQNAVLPATFGPLGPKPLSVAMCLLASQTGRHPIYYAQPKTYALDYSTGCEEIYAYWIKHDGENFYSL